MSISRSRAYGVDTGPLLLAQVRHYTNWLSCMVNTPKPRSDRLWWEIGQLPGANGVAEFFLQVRVAFSDVRFRGCSISLCLAGLGLMILAAWPAKLLFEDSGRVEMNTVL